MIHHGAVRALNERNDGCRQPLGFQHLSEEGRQRSVTRVGLRAPAKYAGVTRLKTEGCRIHGDVGPRFENDPHDPQGHAHAPHLNTRGAVREIAHGTHGIGERHNLPKSLDHAIEGQVIQPKTVEHGGIEAPGLAGGKILSIGGLEEGPSPIDAVRHGV